MSKDDFSLTYVLYYTVFSNHSESSSSREKVYESIVTSNLPEKNAILFYILHFFKKRKHWFPDFRSPSPTHALLINFFFNN